MRESALTFTVSRWPHPHEARGVRRDDDREPMSDPTNAELKRREVLEELADALAALQRRTPTRRNRASNVAAGSAAPPRIPPGSGNIERGWVRGKRLAGYCLGLPVACVAQSKTRGRSRTVSLPAAWDRAEARWTTCS